MKVVFGGVAHHMRRLFLRLLFFWARETNRCTWQESQVGKSRWRGNDGVDNRKSSGNGI